VHAAPAASTEARIEENERSTKPGKKKGRTKFNRVPQLISTRAVLKSFSWFHYDLEISFTITNHWKEKHTQRENVIEYVRRTQWATAVVGSESNVALRVHANPARWERFVPYKMKARKTTNKRRQTAVYL
jgi:hypothetical protein